MFSTPNRRDRVEVLLQDAEGNFLVEQMLDVRYPENRGKIRLQGGAIEEGETPEDAAIRELQEEYGIKLRSRNLWRMADADLPCGSVVFRFMADHGCENIGEQHSGLGLERLVACQTIPPVGQMIDLPVDSEHRIEKYDAFYAEADDAVQVS